MTIDEIIEKLNNNPNVIKKDLSFIKYALDTCCEMAEADEISPFCFINYNILYILELARRSGIEASVVESAFRNIFDQNTKLTFK